MVVTVPAGKGGQQHEQCFNGTPARVLGAGGTPMFLDVAPVTHRFLLQALPDDATDSLLAATAAQVGVVRLAATHTAEWHRCRDHL